MNSLYFYDFTMNSLFISWFHYEFTFYFAILFRDFKPLSFFQNHYEYTILFPKSIRIHYLFRELTRHLSFFCEFTTYFANFLWIHNGTVQSTRIRYLFRKFSLNPLSFSWFHNEYTIYFVISLWIYYLYCDFTMNSLSISRFYY